MRLYNNRGHRKYLTPAERREFLQAAQRAPEKVRTFCATLTYTGCRISEALALTADRVDLADGVLVFESLKKRRRGVYRAVPVPPDLLSHLDAVHDLRSARFQEGRGYGVPLWDWSRATAWRRVREIMDAAGITGLHASPKGLRHGFGIKATASKVPLNLTQKWLGHTQISTTSIYADAVGPEEKEIAERMWD
jgi:integrase/recombinase XerD